MLVQSKDVSTEYATEKGETALQKAAANGHIDVCHFLMDNGAKPNHQDILGARGGGSTRIGPKPQLDPTPIPMPNRSVGRLLPAVY